MRPSKTLLIALALPVLALLALAGCGGGGGDDSTAAETTTQAAPKLSKEELITQGDAICAEVNAAVGALGEGADVKETTIQVSNLYTGMVQSLEALGSPEDAAGYSDFLAAAEELAKVEGEVKLAAEREDTAALGEAASAATPALEEFQSQAAVFGFEECSEGPSAPTPGTGEGAAGSGEVEEGGVEVAPEVEEEVAPEEAAPEEVAPETGGAGGGVEEGAAPETGGSSSGGIGPG